MSAGFPILTPWALQISGYHWQLQRVSPSASVPYAQQKNDKAAKGGKCCHVGSASGSEAVRR